MRTIIATALVVAAMPALACTPQDVQAKATQLMTEAQQLAMRNPQAAADWSKRASEAQARAQQATDLPQICKLYDEVLADLRNVK